MSCWTVRSFATIVAAALTLIGAGPDARADLSIVSVVGGAPTGVNYVNFDNLTPGSTGGQADVTANSADPGSYVTVSITPDGAAVQGSVSGEYAAPYLSGSNGANFGNSGTGPDMTTYLSTGTGSVTLTFNSPQEYLGLLWGSVNAYNTLTFYNSLGQAIGSITGSQVTSTADGDQGADGTYYVNIDSTLAFTSVTMTSSQNAFEFDNVAFDALPMATPEPSAFVVALVGAAGMIAYGRLRRAGPSA